MLSRDTYKAVNRIVRVGTKEVPVQSSGEQVDNSENNNSNVENNVTDTNNGVVPENNVDN